MGGLGILSAEQALELGSAVAKGKNTIAVMTGTLAKKAEGKAIWGVVTAKIAELAVSAPLLIITLALITAMGVFVGVVAGLKFVVDELSNAWNKDALALESARKNTEEAQKAFDEATNSFNSLKTAITDYNEMQDALSALTEGTKEWE